KLIISNMNRLDQMITKVLDASRLSAGQTMAVEFESCDLDLIIRQVVDELNLSYPDIVRVESLGSCEGFWDETGLRRIVENLVSNGIKYGNETQPVTVTLNQENESVELWVHNFGKTIPEEEVPNLFEPFSRLKNDKDKIGWGLG